MPGMPQWTSGTQLSSTGVGPKHEGILGNERADELAKKGTDTPFTGPEPVLGLPYSMVNQAIGDWWRGNT